MKTIALILGLFVQSTAWSLPIPFHIYFIGEAPQHASFLPAGGGTLEDDVFFPIVYLDQITPTSGRVLEQQPDLSFQTIASLDVVFASYLIGEQSGAAYSLEGQVQLTQTQIDNLLAGNWFAEVTLGDKVYLGQFLEVPEPSVIALALIGTGFMAARLRRSRRRGDGRTVPTSLK